MPHPLTAPNRPDTPTTKTIISTDHPALPLLVEHDISSSAADALHNRVRIALIHSWRYAFEGQARLAADVGVSRSTICRLIAGKRIPSDRLVQAITDALSEDMGIPLNARDLFSPDGTYPTCSGCKLCGCDGCLPEEAYDAKGNRKPGYENMQAGDWSLAPASTNVV
jgi:hypothetical protein